MKKVAFTIFLILLSCQLALFSADIFTVASSGTVAEVQQAIKAGADVNARNDNGSTPLMYAAMSNINSEVVSVLIKAGADVNAKDSTGVTPLLVAAGANTISEVVSVLIKAGANVNARADNGTTPLMIAVRYSTNTEVLSVLIKAGADVNAMTDDGSTPLLFAALFNTNPDVVSVLIKAGADVNARNDDGSTPLMIAVRYNTNAEVLSMLIKAGADVNATAEEGSVTPLMLASGNNTNAEVVSLLIKSGANVNARTNEGFTPLMYAATSNTNSEVLSILIKAGADVNARFGGGFVPLMFAALRNTNPDVLSVLIMAGADISLMDDSGKTAFDYAKENPAIKGTKIYWELNGLEGNVNSTYGQKIKDFGRSSMIDYRNIPLEAKKREVEDYRKFLPEAKSIYDQPKEFVYKIDYDAKHDTADFLCEFYETSDDPSSRLNQQGAAQIVKLINPDMDPAYIDRNIGSMIESSVGQNLDYKGVWKEFTASFNSASNNIKISEKLMDLFVNNQNILDTPEFKVKQDEVFKYIDSMPVSKRTDYTNIGKFAGFLVSSGNHLPYMFSRWNQESVSTLRKLFSVKDSNGNELSDKAKWEIIKKIL